MNFITKAAFALVFVAAPGLAETTPTIETKSKTPVEASAPEKKKCRSMQETGSKLAARKICHTKAVWVEIDKANREHTEAYTGALGRTRSNTQGQ